MAFEHTLPKLRREIKSTYKHLGRWRLVAAEYGITCGMAYRIAHGYEPKEPRIRCILGLPALAPAPVCPVHNVVHVGRCPRRKVTRWRDLTTEELRWALENRTPL